VALYASIGGVGAGALGTALAFGIAWMAMIAVAGHISGGHFNPAVTLGAAVAGRLRWSALLPYWLAQVVGGALATALLFIVTSNFPAVEGDEKTLFGQVANGFREHSPVAVQAGGVGFGALGAFVIEATLTAVLVTVFLGARSRRAQRLLAPVTIGFTLTALVLVALPVTNGALNPARATAAALFAESWALEQLWLFWAAPLLGGAIAGAVAFVLFEPRMTVLELEDDDEVPDEGERDEDDDEGVAVGAADLEHDDPAASRRGDGDVVR
jgi:aquaporin Z